MAQNFSLESHHSNGPFSFSEKGDDHKGEHILVPEKGAHRKWVRGLALPSEQMHLH